MSSTFGTLFVRFPDGYNPQFNAVEVYNYNELEECPNGFICSATQMANCSDIQDAAIEYFKLGDIHGGVYCPLNMRFYQNCEIGYSCPNPETKEVCPAGYFCPHKTRIPEIRCARCPAGSQELVRDSYGIIILIVFSLLVGIYLGSKFFRTRVEHWQSKLEEMRNRMVTKQQMEKEEKEYQQRLARIRPQLEMINQRLRDAREEQLIFNLSQTASTSGHSHTSTAITFGQSGQIEFNPGEIFDTIDYNGGGVLTYKELNVIMQLDPLVLNDFMRRMNALSSEENTDKKFVTRDNFEQYFLEALEETSHFRPTTEEAAALWDEMYEAAGDTAREEVPFDSLYSSSLGRFLTDLQIRDVVIGMLKAKETERVLDRVQSSSRAHSNFLAPGDYKGVSKGIFVVYYPDVLEEILSEQIRDTEARRKNGIDITFQNLNLVVKVGRSDGVKVVNDVSGRIESGTMTALLGGSGAGKTSLLNALCGRAYYGEVQGNVFINGQMAAMEDFTGCIGFVPQDDIVFAELTVRENLIYSGRFRLPRGTPPQVIEDLADSVLAKLGLSRKANSIVGDVTRRGVSGGEKKRVNIGLELMAKPTALFLDEPTSGLDASSALLVMMSLKQLVRKEGVTVCSVIHQPRKFIFDLFHSVILLGAGGRMVYHGPVDEAHEYFSSLGYELPDGESLADWLIDISSGRIAAGSVSSSDVVHKREEPREDPSEASSLTLSRKASMGITSKHSRQPPDRHEVRESKSATAATPKTSVKVTASGSSSGPSSNKADRAENEARVRRELLYKHWEDFFQRMDEFRREMYDPPEPYAMPEKTEKPSFWMQLLLQIKRIFLLSWRNRVTKIIDTTVIVFAVTAMSFFVGVTQLSQPDLPMVPFEAFISANPQFIIDYFPELFAFVLRTNESFAMYGLSVGLIASILIALTSAKTITEKRLEFFREAGSGYDVSAYFLAINACTTMEQGLQMVLAAIMAQWTRKSIAPTSVFVVAFLLLGWVSVAWSLLIALVVPPKSITVILGFFMAFLGLLFGGSIEPGTYADVRCLPAQTGFTIDDEAVNFMRSDSTFNTLSWAMNSLDVTDRSCNGWYWNVWPAIFVGITVRYVSFGIINSFNLEQHAKKSFWYKLRHQGSARLYLSVGLFVLFFLVLFIISSYFVLREV